MDSANFQQTIQVYFANNTELLLHEHWEGCIEIANPKGEIFHVVKQLIFSKLLKTFRGMAKFVFCFEIY